MSGVRSTHIPDTPLLRYFRQPLFRRKGHVGWRDDRLREAERLLAAPENLASMFLESVRLVERTYANFQPFYDRPRCVGETVGQQLRATVDVAARLARQPRWEVSGSARLDFVYLDRELELGRAKPAATYPPRGKLITDLFLANAKDATPILCELKLPTDQSPFYALIQILTHAAYGATPAQRARLVLWGSTRDRVLKEARVGVPAPIDLYVMLVKPHIDAKTRSLFDVAVQLAQRLLTFDEITPYVRRIAWIEAEDDRRLGLRLADATKRGRPHACPMR